MKKIKDFLSKLGLYGFLFVLILFPFGIGNGYRVVKFWIDDAPINSDWRLDLGSKGEIEYIANFWGKFSFLNLNAFMRNLLGQREMNGIVKLNNGYLFTPTDFVDDETLERNVASLANLSRLLSKTDTEFLVAIAPDTISKYDPQLPPGTEEYVNDNLDRLIPMIEEQGINVMDFREVIHEDGLDQYTLMYKTDHHWKTTTGFYAYGKLADWIEERTGVEVDEEIRNIENYSITTYKNWHLGSRGERTGTMFAGIDDFDLILPEFETMITDGEQTGTFAELFINYGPFSEKDVTARATYVTALSPACGNYKNLLASNDLKILMVGDSFSEAVCAYMNISYGEIRYFYCLELDQFTVGYIEDYDPDVVICLYYPENIFDENGVAFNIPYIEDTVK